MPLIDQVTQPHRRSRATPRKILQGFLDRIRQLPDYREGNAIISDQPIPETISTLGRYGVTVSFGSGQFSRQTFESSSHQQATSRATVTVAVFVKNLRERVGKRNSPVLDERGVLDRFEEVLKCLVVADPSKGRFSQQWEPVELSGPNKGTPLLRSLPVPLTYSDPFEVSGAPGWMAITVPFEVTFDWDFYD